MTNMDVDIAAQAPGWRITQKPPKIERRFTFVTYAETSAFLDRLAELSKQDSFYPDLSFGRTHVHVTIAARDEQALSSLDVEFARRTTALAEPSVSSA